VFRLTKERHVSFQADVSIEATSDGANGTGGPAGAVAEERRDCWFIASGRRGLVATYRSLETPADTSYRSVATFWAQAGAAMHTSIARRRVFASQTP